MKKFILGFIVGALFCSIIPAYAAVQTVEAKLSTVKCEINGNGYDMESLNYADKNRFPIRDIAEKLGATVSVDQDGTIIVNSPLDKPADNSNTNPNVSTKPISTPDGITQIENCDGKYFISATKIMFVHSSCQFKMNHETNKYYIEKNNSVILENVETTMYFGHTYVEFNYYVNTVLPLL